MVVLAVIYLFPVVGVLLLSFWELIRNFENLRFVVVDVEYDQKKMR